MVGELAFACAREDAVGLDSLEKVLEEGVDVAEVVVLEGRF